MGHRASGKTSVGKRLAPVLGYLFYDTDDLIRKDTGTSIRTIVSQEGWDAFRHQEQKAIADISRVSGAIIALGGGAVMDPANVANLKETGVFVWLTADAETLTKRIDVDGESIDMRPSLSERGGLDEVKQMLAIRNPVYQALADVTLDTVGKDIDAVAEEVLRSLAALALPATKHLVRGKGSHQSSR
jgi:shikimate kinase